MMQSPTGQVRDQNPCRGTWNFRCSPLLKIRVRMSPRQAGKFGAPLMLALWIPDLLTVYYCVPHKSSLP
jgi:hypothetical protein